MNPHKSLDKSSVDVHAYSLEQFGHLYYWPDAEKAKFIADATCLVFLTSALSCTLLGFLSLQNLHVSYENLPWARNIAYVSAFVFFVIRVLSTQTRHSAVLAKVALSSNMVVMSVCLPLFFSTIGIFDGFCWFILFLYAAVGFVVLEPRLILRTQVATLFVMIVLTFSDPLLPYNVRAYIVSTEGYVSSFSHNDLLFKWFMMFVTSLLGMVILGYLTGAWQRREQDLRSISYQDELTGLMNRRSILEGLQKEFQMARDETRRLSVAMIDLDFFKKVNDTYGHPFGDKALKLVAAQGKKVVRRHDLLGRYGGEEFLVVFPGCPLQEAAKVLERLRENLAETPLLTDTNIPVTITLSAGVAELKGDDIDMFALIERADTGLYQAKENGRDQVVSMEGWGINQP